MWRGHPVGWRRESYRHALAARGVKTSYYASKDLIRRASRGYGLDPLMIPEYREALPVEQVKALLKKKSEEQAERRKEASEARALERQQEEEYKRFLIEEAGVKPEQLYGFTETRAPKRKVEKGEVAKKPEGKVVVREEDAFIEVPWEGYNMKSVVVPILGKHKHAGQVAVPIVERLKLYSMVKADLKFKKGWADYGNFLKAFPQYSESDLWDIYVSAQLAGTKEALGYGERLNRFKARYEKAVGMRRPSKEVSEETLSRRERRKQILEEYGEAAQKLYEKRVPESARPETVTLEEEMARLAKLEREDPEAFLREQMLGQKIVGNIGKKRGS